MQLPVQGRFSEQPGWALRPAFGQNDWRTNTAWRQPGNARRLRRHLYGFGGMLPNISVQYTGDPQTDFNLQLQTLGDWYSKYYQQAYSISEQVISGLRSRGYQVDVIQRPEDICSPSAGCADFTGHVVKLRKDGRELVTGTGDRGLYSRLNSVQEVVDMIDRQFSMYATAAPGSATTSTTTATTTGSAVTSASVSTPTAAPATTTTSSYYYSRSAVLVVPDGYRVGGRFTLKIQGAPNSQVSIRAWQNGVDHGTNTFGTTNSQGYYEISGIWQDTHSGQWREIVYVGGEQVGELNFTLTKPEQPPVNTASTGTSIVTTSQEPVLTQDEIPSSATQPTVVTKPADPQDTSQSTVQLSGLALLIAAGAVLLLISGNGKK